MTLNERLVLNLVERMEKKLHFPKDTFTLKRDNRIRGFCITLYHYIDGNKEVCYMITYNATKLNNKLEILMGVLHEMGHARLDHLLTYQSLSVEEMEYQAERFALDVVKKYYPEYYLRAVDYLLKYIDGSDNLYARAFEKLYDERCGSENEKKR